MLHHHPPHPTKYHPNSLSQFLAMHHHHHHQHHQQHQHRIPSPPPTSILDDIDPTGATQIDSVAFGGIGKSFTIAAILGLKKNAAAAAAAVAIEQHHQQQQHHQHQMQHHLPHHNTLQHHHQQQQHHPHPFHMHTSSAGGREYSSVMNLSINNSPTNNGGPSNNNSNLSNNNNNNNNTVSHNNNNNLHRMPVTLEKHGHHQMNNHSSLHSATSALQSLQQLQQAHGAVAAAAAASVFTTGRDRSKNDHIVSKKNSLKSKRVRTIFTPEQLERLESEFERQQYMVGPERLYLAHTLQLTEAQVKVWFQNRRIKWRKHHLELTQQKLAMIRQHQGPSGLAPPNSSAGGGGSSLSAAAPSHSPSSPMASSTLPPPECDVSVCTDSMDSRGSLPDADPENDD